MTGNSFWAHVTNTLFYLWSHCWATALGINFPSTFYCSVIYLSTDPSLTRPPKQLLTIYAHSLQCYMVIAYLLTTPSTALVHFPRVLQLSFIVLQAWLFDSLSHMIALLLAIFLGVTITITQLWAMHIHAFLLCSVICLLSLILLSLLSPSYPCPLPYCHFPRGLYMCHGHTILNVWRFFLILSLHYWQFFLGASIMITLLIFGPVIVPQHWACQSVFVYVLM